MFTAKRLQKMGPQGLTYGEHCVHLIIYGFSQNVPDLLDSTKITQCSSENRFCRKGRLLKIRFSFFVVVRPIWSSHAGSCKIRVTALLCLQNRSILADRFQDGNFFPGNLFLPSFLPLTGCIINRYCRSSKSQGFNTKRLPQLHSSHILYARSRLCSICYSTTSYTKVGTTFRRNG